MSNFLMQKLNEILRRQGQRNLDDAEEFFAACEEAHERYGVYGDMVEMARANVDKCRAAVARLEAE